MKSAKTRLKKFLKRHKILLPVFLVLKQINRLRYAAQQCLNPNKHYRMVRKHLRTQVFPTPAQLDAQRHVVFESKPVISILVPLYNTPLQFLRELFSSMEKQTYPHWELCLADGSDEQHGTVQKMCEDFSLKDTRIRYQKLAHNGGISNNTNACIKMADGSYLALLDHDDMLHPSALYETVKVINEEHADFIYTDEMVFSSNLRNIVQAQFKPDYAPDTLLSVNYICHFAVFSRELLESDTPFDSLYDGSQDYDLFLRLTERARKIYHIAKVLYFWRQHINSVTAGMDVKSYATEAGAKAIKKQLLEKYPDAEVNYVAGSSGLYRVKYPIQGTPLVSILIPNMDHVDDLKTCIDSIKKISTYENYEIIVVENNSREPETFEYYQAAKDASTKVRIITWQGTGFNFSALCNYGANAAQGDFLLFLNNDMQVIAPDWIQEMLMHAQRPDIGVVGALLRYPDDTVQHAGVIIGVDAGRQSYAEHIYRGRSVSQLYGKSLLYVRNMSAVTGACMMIRQEVFNQIEGFDETFPVTFNDIDFCIKLIQAGYRNIFTPYAELYHYESKTRGLDSEDSEKGEEYVLEREKFYAKWSSVLEQYDPYWNPNLSLYVEDYSFTL